MTMRSPQYSTPRLSDFSPPKIRLSDPTSDDEVTRHSLERLQLLLIRKSNVEERLEQIESAAGGYRMKQKALKDEIFLYRAVLAPIRNLSIEVLTIILGFLLASSPDDIRHVGLVCIQWRNATLEASRLWSHIIVARECHAFEQKVILFGKRSNAHLLKVSYTQSIDPTKRWVAWDQLLSTAPRWTTLALTFDDCRSALMRIPHLVSSPRLQELSVTIRHQSPRAGYEGKYGFDLYDEAKTPSLRSLILSTHILPRENSWFTKLTSLHITDTFAGLVNSMTLLEPIHGNHVLNILRACPKLENFSFEAGDSSHWFASKKASMDVLGWPVRLPNLRRLRLTCHYTVGNCLLEYIIPTESLEDVTLHLLPRLQSLSQRKLAATAQTFFVSCPRIRTLSLYGINYRAITTSIKRGLQELQELHLKLVSGVENLSELDKIAHCLLQNETKADDDFWCVPRLSNLLIDANRNDVPFDQLASAIKARYSANLWHGKPFAIQRFVVNNQNLLDDAAPGDILQYNHLERSRFSLDPAR